ncbi:MAG: leucyl aminopeptidase [Alphaproteobacteria bacterium]
MKISFAAPAIPKSGTLVLGLAKDGKLKGLGLEADKAAKGGLSRAIRAAGFEGGHGATLSIPGPDGLSLNRVIILGLGDKPGKKAKDLGGKAYKALSATKDKAAAIALDLVKAEDLAEFALGARLAAYRFDSYRTKNVKTPALTTLKIMSANAAAARKAHAPREAVGQGVYLARDLVSEPPNKLTPKEFAKRTRALTKLGVKVEVLGEAAMAKLGMGSLLGVGQGSRQESQLVVMQWNGAAKSKKPVAFVGKGVTFDTGGISLKPGAGMWDMKMDMGGAAAVTGLMHTLASRNAKVNAVGVIGLVENMPDGNAQRPADIVTSMSGQTIEVLNTDAEGRLVLADALWYCQDRFKPTHMIDLATLTGAIIVSLGHEYTGVFSNDDKLAGNLVKAGEKTGDKAWHMPMHENFNKALKSAVADVANITRSGGGGSISAACFLERFVNDVPWAHLDIAGAAWRMDAQPTSPAGATGAGVQMLNQLVIDQFEG